MRVGPHVLITLLLVAGGILVYSVIRGVDTPLGLTEPESLPDERVSARVEAVPREIEGRIAALERVLDGIRHDLVRAEDAGTGEGPSHAPPPVTVPIPRAGEGPFDEGTLAALRAYVEEIERRKHVEAQRRLVASALLRQDLGLSEEQEHDVVETTIAYQARARDLMRRRWAPGAAGQRQRREAVESLQGEYLTALGRLVSAYDAERIMESPVAPGRSMMLGSGASHDEDD